MNIVIDEQSQYLEESTPVEFSFYDPTQEILAKELDFQLNYSLPMLRHIAGFYEIPYNRIKKNDLIYSIIEFESNLDNKETVENRKRLWYYMEEIKSNKYLSKYILSI